MKTQCTNLFMTAAAVTVLAVGGLAHADRAGLTTSGLTGRPVTAPQPIGTPCGTGVLTQSTDPKTIGTGTVQCAGGSPQYTTANGLARSFAIQNELAVCAVQFGIQTNINGDWPLTVNLYEGSITGAFGNLEHRGASTVVIPDGAGPELFVVIFDPPVKFLPGENMVVELFHDSRNPDDGGDGGALWPASNNLGESAPSYIRADACGITNFITYASIGFPDVHLAIKVFVGPNDGTDCQGDINNDGVVDVSDLLALLAAWGPCPDPNDCPADINEDGVVDVSDLLALLANWGPCETPPGTGACCFDDGSCVPDLTEEECGDIQGNYGGNFSGCEQCPQPPDGSTCNDALPFTIDGPGVTIDTTGNPTPDAPLCGGVTPSQPTAWFSVSPDTDQFLTAYACTATAEARVAVYCGDCDQSAEPLLCLAGGSQNNDNTVCGNPFDGQATWCAGANNTYYIAVWRETGGEGEIEVHVQSGGACTSTTVCQTIFDPVCELPLANCQAGPTGGTWASSDIRIDDVNGEGGTNMADDFVADATGQITSVCWQGVELSLNPTSSCPNQQGQGHPFNITYYHDAGGIPGTVKAGPFTVNPTFSRIGTINFGFPAGHIDYTADHPPVSVVEGECLWIEIVGQSPEGACAFFWKPSPEGNGLAYRKTGNAPEYTPDDIVTFTPADRHFCVSIATGNPDDCLPALGACCVEGSCTEETASDCAALGGCFTIGAPCSSATCVDADYFYDCGLPPGGLGNDNPNVQWIWVHRFDVKPGQETINEILSAYGGSVPDGQAAGWAIWDSATLPNDTAPTATGSHTVQTPGVQSISIPATTITSGQFYVGVWTNGPFPIPTNDTGPTPAGDVFFMGVDGQIDPAALTLTDITTTAFPNLVWVLRANAQ